MNVISSPTIIDSTSIPLYLANYEANLKLRMSPV